MKLDQFPEHIQPFLIPKSKGEMQYQCLTCERAFDISQLLYTCPDCGGILLLENMHFDELKHISGEKWRDIFDYRKMLTHESLKGIFRYYEFIAPVIPLEKVLYLGEGHTPLVEANGYLKELIGAKFYFKNDGQNPSASFKDRGMACALSFINDLIAVKKIDKLLAICASTGDTSAAAALYASFLGDLIQAAVILPRGKVTPQQLSQPLGSGAKVFEIPGVFDDCMKVVELLAENYPVALLNSKNSWRILGQESFSFEISQDFDYELKNKVIVLPIGNAGNITAVMSGFLKFFKVGIIRHLPKIVGVQSEHADPVYRFYSKNRENISEFQPVAVKPSVAQAAMIGNPVSMPRVVKLVKEYNSQAGEQRIFIARVSEQEIMDAMICANRNGNIACTQGGESLAGFKKAIQEGYASSIDIGVLDSTAHALKFTGFQEMYLNNNFDSEYKVNPKGELRNAPIEILPKNLKQFPTPDKPLKGRELTDFIKKTADEIIRLLDI